MHLVEHNGGWIENCLCDADREILKAIADALTLKALMDVAAFMGDEWYGQDARDTYYSISTIQRRINDRDEKNRVEKEPKE